MTTSLSYPGFGTRQKGWRTAELVTEGHPDKFCDQVADAVLDQALAGDPGSRVALECLAKRNLLFLSGELTSLAKLDFESIARGVYERIGYGDGRELAVINHVREQCPDIRDLVDVGGEALPGAAGSGEGEGPGAGDQGIMVGYATDESPDMMPLEYVHARALALRLRELRDEIDWLRADGKTQVTMMDGRVTSIVLAAHHDAAASPDLVRETLRLRVIEPLFGSEVKRVVVNGGQVFTVGGPHADAGVVGRKIVSDAYGPRVPVGGGAYSGKDATKVDRSAAYMARQIAKTVVKHQVAGARECLVSLAFAIGQRQPEMVAAVTDGGHDVSSWVKTQFGDLSPGAIIERLGLRQPTGWSYLDTAAYGHYGRAEFPWEAVPQTVVSWS